MAEFEIKIRQIKSSVECERNIAEKIASAGGELTECKNALDTSVSRQYAAVKRNLNGLNSSLSSSAGYMRSMAQALETVCGTYERTESEITGQKIEYVKTQEAKSYTSPSINETKSETEWKDILSFFSKLIKGANWKSDNPYAKTLASFLSTYASGLKLGDSGSIAEWYTAFVGFAGSTIGLGGKFGNSFSKLAEKYGTSSLKAWFAKNGETFSSEMGAFGTFSNAFGFSSSYLKAIQDSDSFASFLKNSDGWLTSGKDLVLDLNGLGKEFNKTTGGPAASLLSMGSYFAGDIIDLSTDGHPMTADELSKLCLGTGLTGLKSGVSQITLGLVDLDVDRSMGIFDKNIGWAQDQINSMDISTGGKVTLGIVSTPVVAAWSVGETIYDFGYQIGEGINNGIQSVWNFVTGGNAGASGSGGKMSAGGGGGGGR